MHLMKPGGFDISSFFRDIVSPPEDERDLGLQQEPCTKLDDLLKRVRAKDHKKRAMARYSRPTRTQFDLPLLFLTCWCLTVNSVRLFLLFYSVSTCVLARRYKWLWDFMRRRWRLENHLQSDCTGKPTNPCAAKREPFTPRLAVCCYLVT